MNTIALGRPRAQTGGDHYCVPARFENAIFLHLLGNAIGVQGFPLMLGIHGPSGHGKSFQCTVLLSRWNLLTRHVSGSRLENSAAGGPTRVLNDEYKAASDASRNEGRQSCIVIDDIDAGIGHFGQDVTYTVNRQNVSAALMNLCDHPNTMEGQSVQRVPIIVTANALHTLYAPLIRHQRMTVFHWEVDPMEKSEIVVRMFSDLLPPENAIKLVKQFEAEPVAFFAHVLSDYFSYVLLQQSHAQERGQLLRDVFVDPAAKETIMRNISRGCGDAYSTVTRVARELHEQRHRLNTQGPTRSART